MGLNESKNVFCGAVRLASGRKRLGQVVGLVLVLAACGGSDKPAPSATAGQGGGSGTDTTAGGATGTAGGGAGISGVSGSGGSTQPSGCPSGTQCAAPLGALVCTLTSTGSPPTCSAQQPCSFGQCQQISGQGYCVQNCGPAAVATCAAGSQCINPTGTYYTPTGSFFCSLADTGLPPDCSSQTCAYGECLQYGYGATATKACIQPCTAPAVASCPSGADCTVFGLNTICVKNETGIPPTCNSKADCGYGDCVKSLGQGYCVQYCPTPVNRVTGLVESYPAQGGTIPVPVEGVEVCLYRNTQVPCATTRADGTFVLRGLPKADYFVLTLKKSGYVPTLRLSYTYEVQTALTATILYTEAQMTAAATSVGAKYPDAANGFITFFGTTTTNATLALLGGFTATLTPTSGTGPFYLNAQGTLDKSLTSASAFGSGAYFNVAPAKYKLQFSHSTLNCGTAEDVLVEAGYVSANVPAYCE